ncbi:Cyclin N-terminal domain-containing protein [Mycena venus]|uniref:Cyclin N-terminal domain-containing protein n=1 Tax=Mycena venus TaxID=2733690 RepID=A0A8H6XIQ0_9AGAR|nr:Cyclin N-terminal domain-containing protein [Mycena venus]
MLSESRAEVASATILVPLVYIARIRTHLFIVLEEWDSTLKNMHWALCTGIFWAQIPEVLYWELGVQAHCEALVAAASGFQFEARANVELACAKAGGG